MLTDPVENKISDSVVDKNLLGYVEKANEWTINLGNRNRDGAYEEWEFQGSRLTTQTNNGTRYAY
jgi:hypothetical protein